MEGVSKSIIMIKVLLNVRLTWQYCGISDMNMVPADVMAEEMGAKYIIGEKYSSSELL